VTRHGFRPSRSDGAFGADGWAGDSASRGNALGLFLRNGQDVAEKLRRLQGYVARE